MNPEILKTTATEVLLRFVWRAPAVRTAPPLRVYLHINGIHDHHQRQSLIMRKCPVSAVADLNPHTAPCDNELTTGNAGELVWAGYSWAVELWAPCDLVASYYIVPLYTDDEVHTLAPEHVDKDVKWWWPKFLSHRVIDPLALHSPWSVLDRASGILRLPGAPCEPGWGLRTGAANSQRAVDSCIAYSSDWLEWSFPKSGKFQGRRIWISRPEADAHDDVDNKSLPLLLMLFDGQRWVRELPLTQALRSLNESSKLPKVYVAAIDFDTLAQRNHELVLEGAKGFSRFVAFDLINELSELCGVPWADHPELVVLSGQSFGGTAAVNIAWRYPARCLNAISNSGPVRYPAFLNDRPEDLLSWPLLALSKSNDKQIANTAAGEGSVTHSGSPEQLPLFILTAGSLEGNMVEQNSMLIAALTKCGAAAQTRFGTHAHDMAAWRGNLTWGLLEIAKARGYGS